MATFETITAFDGGSAGGNPLAGLTKDSAGNLYGVNTIGGANGRGTAFRLTYDSANDTYGAPRTIATFGTSTTDGGIPTGSLIQDSQGNLYGTTQFGGPDGPNGVGRGTVFKLGYDGGSDSYTRTTLVGFAEQDDPDKTGIAPQGNLHRDGAGNLYGVLPQDGPGGGGSIFKVTYDGGSGTYSATPGIVASFDNIAANDLLADSAGNLYGTTIAGGPDGGGTLFRLTYDGASGTYAGTPVVVASFGTNSQGDSVTPSGRLSMDADRNIYGTTEYGGANGAGTVFKLIYNSGTSGYGAPVTIASFDGTTGGYAPRGGVIVDAAGNLYGTTLVGGDIDPDPGAGDPGKGTVFKIGYDPGTHTYGPIQTLHRFDGTDGMGPVGTLVADDRGRLYGTTSSGGDNDKGTVFRISDAGYVCFTTGTRIRTERGEVPVEALRVGERAVTASGEARAIRWIGHRRLAPHHQPAPQAAHPVRIAAHAFGEGRPARDLFVSPAHAIAVDVLGAVLIPACRLINGTTITQVEADEVTYWHVELDSHDILLAEGLPAESYLDCGNRRFFAEAEATDLVGLPDARPDGPLPFCRPFHEAGALVDLVRTRIAARAESLGWRRVEEAFAGLHLVADGKTIRPDMEGLTARFVLPAGARTVRLVSGTSVPAHVVPGSTDDRRLGVPLAALVIDDGLTGARAIALDDPRLEAGFHAAEGGARWTRGAAPLPADLWAGCKGIVFLRVSLSGPALPRWIAPGETAGAVASAEIRRRA